MIIFIWRDINVLTGYIEFENRIAEPISSHFRHLGFSVYPCDQESYEMTKTGMGWDIIYHSGPGKYIFLSVVASVHVQVGR